MKNLPLKNDFHLGAACVFDGFKDIFNPRLRHFVFVPLMINIVIFGALLYFGSHYLLLKINALSTVTLPGWLLWLDWVIKVFKYIVTGSMIIILFVVLAILSTFCANFIAAPFNGLLSEAYSELLGQSIPKRSLWKTTIKTIEREIQKVFYYLLRLLLLGIFAIILYFLPPLSLLTPVLFFLFGAWMFTIEYIDYPADSQHIQFKSVLKKLKEHRIMYFGFGVTIALFSSIPLINLFVMPVAVLGATRLWYCHESFPLVIKE